MLEEQAVDMKGSAVGLDWVDFLPKALLSACGGFYSGPKFSLFLGKMAQCPFSLLNPLQAWLLWFQESKARCLRFVGFPGLNGEKELF